MIRKVNIYNNMKQIKKLLRIFKINRRREYVI